MQQNYKKHCSFALKGPLWFLENMPGLAKLVNGDGKSWFLVRESHGKVMENESSWAVATLILIYETFL